MMIARPAARPVLRWRNGPLTLLVSAAAVLSVVAACCLAGPASAAAQHSTSRLDRQAGYVTLRTLVAGVNVHNTPGPQARRLGRIVRQGTAVVIACYTTGPRVAGNPIWYLLAKPVRGYVTSYYMDSHYDPAAGVTRCADPRADPSPQSGRVYRTLVAGVHIRYWPTAFATRLATIQKMGSRVTVDCYVRGESIGGDDVWYHVTAPVAGFVSGAHLNTGHDPAYGIPACW
jgi:hypothetical protein